MGYSADEFQGILKPGVWIRLQIERKIPVGELQAAARYRLTTREKESVVSSQSRVITLR